MNKQVMHTALIALGSFAIIYLVQQKVMAIPVIGEYLPGGKATA